MSQLKCNCGNKTNTIRYVHGKKTCQKCAPQNLSGQFLRRLEGEANYYQADIQQKYKKNGTINENFQQIYGEGRNTTAEARRKKAK